jgi:hypothetical protein
MKVTVTTEHGEMSGQDAVDQLRRDVVEAREDWREAAQRAIDKPTDEDFRCWDTDREAHRLYERYKTCLLQFCDVERAVGEE